MNPLKILFFLVIYIRFIPYVLLLLFHPKRTILKSELNQWLYIIRVKRKGIVGFLWLLRNLLEYRSVFHLRIGRLGMFFRFFYREQTSTHIHTPNELIGSGFILQHGFSSIINAKEIGDNCQIWHNVTIGLSQSGTNKKPTIGSDVKICAGAIILGDVRVGDRVVIGAGAVVVKEVPDDCVVVGNPACIIKRNGQKVIEKL